MLPLSLLIFFALPALLIWASPRVKLISWLSPAFWCYALGIFLGNILPIDHGLTELMQQGTVALAIPLLLFPSEIHTWKRLAGKTLLSFVVWVIGVGLSAIGAFWIWNNYFEYPTEMAGMASSVYTGGTANMSAVQFAIQAPSQLFDTMNLSDLSFSGMYLIFVLTLAQRFFLRFLTPFPRTSSNSDEAISMSESGKIKEPRSRISSLLKSLGMAMLVLTLSAGSSWLIFGKLEETLVVILLAALALGASLIPSIRNLPLSYDTGEYLFLMFCVVVGSRVDLIAVLQSVPSTLGFMATIALGTVAFHSFWAWLFKIDADTALITHSAGIFGPPFIGPIANAMKNREIVVSGMTLGVINLAIGNFWGILIYHLLS